MDKSFEPCPSPAPDSKLESSPRLRRPMRYPVAPRPQRTDDLTGSEGERKRVKLTLSAVVAMREARAAGASTKALSETYGVSTSMVAQVCTGAAWTDAPGPITRTRGYGLLEERMERGADRSGGPDACWPWTGSKPDVDGYGRLFIDGKDTLAHRASLEIKLGRKLAPGEVARHAKGCTRMCVNGAHLQPGSSADNNRDAKEHGTWAHGETIAHAKLTEAQALEIRGLGLDVNFEEVGRAYGITGKQVANIIKGRAWNHLTAAVSP